MIPYSRQSVDEEDIAAVVDALRSDWLTTGPYIERFEQALVDYTGARHAVAFANGTAALHACLAAVGTQPNDVVATSPLSFSASANCARYVGAEPVFVDIDQETLNLDTSQIPQCDVLIAVHYAGLPVALDRLTHRPAIIIEDAAQALGAVTPEGPVGNCARSDMTAFSFHPVKTVTSGEGGMVTTNDDGLAQSLRAFRSHGMKRSDHLRPWEYEINSLGYNYRLTDIQAALGWSQMRKVDEFVSRRNALAATYDDAFEGTAILPPPRARDGFVHARHLYPVRIRDRDRVFARMRELGIGVQVHHIPIYRFGIYGGDPSSWPITEAAYDRLLSLPLHPGLSGDEQAFIIEAMLAEVDA